MKTTIEAPAPEMRAPSKSEEIAILRDAIARLGPLSYCGPWLAEQLDGIESDIKSDFLPQMSRAAAMAQCGEMLTAAHDRAAEIQAAAEREAKAKREATLAECERIRTDCAQAIHRAQAAISRW